MPTASSLRRERALVYFFILICLAMSALVLMRAAMRSGATASSYAALAEAFLQGRLWIGKCPEIDCALFDNKTYVIFPPLPAVAMAPIVAAFGAAFAARTQMALTLLFIALALWLWRRIFIALDVPRESINWLLAAITFASPVFYIAFKGDGVWFFAQSLGFLLMTAALASVIVWRSLALAGLFVALAFLCRQMSIFYPLFIAALALPEQQRLSDALRRYPWKPFIIAAVFVAASLAVIFAYNYARFGAPFETGYKYMHNPGMDTLITSRQLDGSLFSFKYFLSNFYYLFLQGFHMNFGGKLGNQPLGMDVFGTSIIAASPWLALMFYMRFDRVAVAGLATIAIIAGLTLLYHSNGFEQVHTQRYALDWLPIAIVLLARSAWSGSQRALPMLVTFAAGMNLIAILSSMAFGVK
ncbi:MAG: hypothetical protein FJX29_11905 [Alphaproteobacteria bacterium]|nr:hypothetical protein [Alphaproteobacteria bacterium]